MADDNNALAQELEPCPFCQGEAQLIKRTNTGITADWCGDAQWWVCCAAEDDCAGQLGLSDSEAEAIAAWNTRNPAPAPVGGDVVEARIWRRDTTNEWVLEINGVVNDTKFVCRHTEPLSTPKEDVAGLPSLYAALQSPPAPNCPACGDPACQWGGVPANCQMWGKEPPAPEQDVVERIALAIDPEAFSAETIQESYYPSARKRLSERQEKARKNARAALAAMPPKVEAPAADEVREPSVVYDVAMPPMAGTQPQPAAAVAVERERCAGLLDALLDSQALKLLAGEMTAQEVRTVKAVLTNRAAAIRSGGAS